MSKNMGNDQAPAHNGQGKKRQVKGQVVFRATSMEGELCRGCKMAGALHRQTEFLMGEGGREGVGVPIKTSSSP